MNAILLGKSKINVYPWHSRNWQINFISSFIRFAVEVITSLVYIIHQKKKKQYMEYNQIDKIEAGRLGCAVNNQSEMAYQTGPRHEAVAASMA